MKSKTILVLLNDPRRAKRLLDAAVPLARANEAHLIGLSVMPPYVVLPAADGAGVTVTMEEHRELFRTDMAGIKSVFEASTSDLARPAEWRESDAGFDSVSARQLEHARAADLVVTSQVDATWGSSALHEDPERLIMESGRPVLLVPNEGRNALPARRVTVAWDGRREAARAVFDAVPVMGGADDVSLVWINPEKAGQRAGDLPGFDICAALSRHGIKSQMVEAHAIGGDVGAELLRQAKVQGADLLVMGCYGHSRLRELILGGASRHILSNMDLPVLMSH